jgi:hypothetical protein
MPTSLKKRSRLLNMNSLSNNWYYITNLSIATFNERSYILGIQSMPK